MIRAARVHGTDPDPRRADVRIEELADPRPDPDQVIVDVGACGVCASDLHVVQGVTPVASLPITLGHEAAGTISAVGTDVSQWQPGDRVILPAGQVCGACVMCRGGRDNLCTNIQVLGVDVDGAQASAVAVAASLPLPIPGHVPFDQAALLADAVATPYHALKRGGVGQDAVVAVIGLGGLGFHAVQLAVLTGATVIAVDVDDTALERAARAGASVMVDARDDDAVATVIEATGGGAEVSFEFVGRPDTVAMASRILRPGGRAVLVGIGRERLTGPPLGLFVAREQEVVGSFGATLADVNELIDLLDAGRLDLTRSVSHTLDLDDFPTALEMLHTRRGSPLRIVIDHS